MIRTYRQAGATEPERACAPAELGIRHSWLFQRLSQRGVFVLVADGRYFLDETVAQDFLHQRRVRALALAFAFLLIFIIAMSMV